MLQSASVDAKKATARGNSRAPSVPSGLAPLAPELGNQATLRLMRKCDCGSAPDCDCDMADDKKQKEKDSPRTALHRKPSGSGALPASTVLDAESRSFFEARLQRKAFRPASASEAQAFLQPKLKIGPVDDPLEREADRVADHVMRMPEPASLASPLPTGQEIVQRVAHRPERKHAEAAWRRYGTRLQEPSPVNLGIHSLVEPSTMQRDVGTDAIQEQLIRAYLSDAGTLQRKADDPAEGRSQPKPPANEEEAVPGEQILMQAKPASAGVAQPAGNLESATRSLQGGGSPLPVGLRSYMEPRFGHDFSGVRVHADSRAAEAAKLANARAFTIGRDIVFASGEYAPDGSDSRRLLAHELTHVIQQGRGGPRLQRKIMVGGKAYSPSEKYLAYLSATFGAAMREFVEHMHNGGGPPTYSFSSYEQMGREVRVRANAIKGIEVVHKGCCDYYSDAHPPHLNSTYWDQVGGGVDFKLKTGKKPSDAIAAIFAPGAGTSVECLSMTLAIEYYSLLKGLGEAQFNAKFPSGIEISASSSQPLVEGAGKKYKVIAAGSKYEILPGDWVYFKNFKDYLVKHPTGFWQGENAIYLGGSMFRGFGVAAQAENTLNQELVNQYNSGGAASKTVPDLIADGGGLLLNPVVRPIIATVAP